MCTLVSQFRHVTKRPQWWTQVYCTSNCCDEFIFYSKCTVVHIVVFTSWFTWNRCKKFADSCWLIGKRVASVTRIILSFQMQKKNTLHLTQWGKFPFKATHTFNKVYVSTLPFCVITSAFWVPRVCVSWLSGVAPDTGECQGAYIACQFLSKILE